MAGLFNSLQLRQTQKLGLALTPQLQQAIKLLQLSTLELRQEIKAVALQNPMLEVEDDGNDERFESLESLAEQEATADRNDAFDPFDNDSSVKCTDTAFPDANQTVNISSEQNTVQNLSENQDQRHNSADTRHGQSLGNDEVYEGETTEDLHDHLLWQLDLSPLEGADRLIAENIIDGIDDSGYLHESLESIVATVNETYPEITQEDALSVLKLIWNYDPVGIGARNVQECLRLQLEAKTSSATTKLALHIVNEYLKELSVRDFRTLCQKLNIKENELKPAIDLITSLNPRPGRAVSVNQVATNF